MEKFPPTPNLAPNKKLDKSETPKGEPMSKEKAKLIKGVKKAALIQKEGKETNNLKKGVEITKLENQIQETTKSWDLIKALESWDLAKAIETWDLAIVATATISLFLTHLFDWNADLESILSRITDAKDWEDNTWIISSLDNTDISKLRLERKQKNFLREAVPASKVVQKDYWVPWQVCLAQSILETWWWKKAPNNNYFWIKYVEGRSPKRCDPWNQRFLTHEFNKYWERIEIRDSFERHDSVEDSFRRYGQFLTQNDRYNWAFAYKDSPADFIRVIHKWVPWVKGTWWYATSPEYSNKIIKIMKWFWKLSK